MPDYQKRPATYQVEDPQNQGFCYDPTMDPQNTWGNAALQEIIFADGPYVENPRPSSPEEVDDDTGVDEYGLKVPSKTYLERAVEYVAPNHLMQDPNVSGVEKIGRAAAAGFAGIGGIIADEWLGFSVPGHMLHAQEVNEYNEKRAQKEEQRRMEVEMDEYYEKYGEYPTCE
jgi:hypothetical protein